MLISPLDPRPHWFLIRTKAKQEAKALGMLDARGIVCYCPRILESHRHPWEPRGPVPLFPGYLFALIALGDHRSAAQYSPGITGLVRFGEAFAALEEDVIKGFRSREQGRGYIISEQPRRELRAGSRVRVVRGALSGIEGIVCRYVPGRERVKLLLTLSWGVRAAEVTASSVRCA